MTTCKKPEVFFCYRLSLAMATVVFFLLFTGPTTDCWGQGLGGPPNDDVIGKPVPIRSDQLPSFLTAKCGLNHDSTIPENYEIDRNTDQSQGFEPEENRVFGAYTVANLNDSDSDYYAGQSTHRLDKDDNEVRGNGTTGHDHEVEQTLGAPALVDSAAVIATNAIKILVFNVIASIYRELPEPQFGYALPKRNVYRNPSAG